MSPPRAHIETELGKEIKCAKCGEFWPADPEFYYYFKGKPHSWCKACYRNDPKTIAKVQRQLEAARARNQARKEARA